MKFAAARCLPCRRLIAIGILSPTIHPNPARLLAFGDFAANRGGTPCFERSGWKIRRFCTLIPQIVQNVRFQCKYTAARRVPQLPAGRCGFSNWRSREAVFALRGAFLPAAS